MCGGDFERKICAFLKKKENLVIEKGLGVQWGEEDDIMIFFL